MALEKLNINGINEIDFPIGVDSVSVVDDIATVNLAPPTQVIADFLVDSGAPNPIVANDIVAWGVNYNNDGVTQAEGDVTIIGVALTGGNTGDTITVQLVGTVLVNSLGISESSPVVCNSGNPGKAFSNAVGNPYVAEFIAGFGLSSGSGLKLMQIAPYDLPASYSVVTKTYQVEPTAPTGVTAGQAVTINAVSGNTIQACTASDVPLGISFTTTAQGDTAVVILFGAAIALGVGSFSNGTLLAVDASGNVIPSAPAAGASKRIIGMSIGTQTTGSINILVFPGIDVAVSTVTSVFGRTGAVVAATNDYNFNQLAGKAGLAQGGTNVDLSASGGTTKILAQDASHVISARDLVAADIPSLAATYQIRSEKDAASGYAGLDSSIFLKSAEFNLTRNVQSGAYAILDADRAKVVSCTSATSVAWTIAQAGASSAFLAGWYCIVKNTGLGTITLTPATSTIESAAKVIIPPGSSFLLLSDGTNYLMPLENISKVTGRSFFTTDGTDRNLVGSGVLAIVSTANAVIGLQCQLSGPRLVNKVQFGFQANASGSSQTADMGIYDSLGNLIFNIGATTKANGAGATYPSAVPTGGILFMPGNYISSWTCSATTPTFYASVTLVGGATSGFMGNLTVAPFFLAGNAASAGALPATLGTLGSSALGSGDINGNIPIILFLA